VRQKQLVYFRYNVPGYSARIVKRFLVNRGVTEINHPPHSLGVNFDVTVELNAVNLDAFHNCNF
jgi:hypothetical protein